MITFKHICAAVALGALSACSSGGEKSAGQTQTIIETIKARKASRNPTTAPTPTITREVLDVITISSLEAVVEDTNQTAFMIPIAARTNAGPGKVVVWKSGGDENVILRSGVLVGTKGIGNDLASVDAAGTVRAIKSLASGGGEKTYYLRQDNNTEGQIRLRCEITNHGRETIEIVERRFVTTRLREVCSNSTGQIVNDFWVDSRDSAVMKSRQWGGPKLGYLSFRLLKK